MRDSRSASLWLNAVLVLAAAVHARAQVFDCSLQTEKNSFRSALEDTKRDNPSLYRALLAKRLESPLGDKRMCNVYDWCFGQSAKVKWAPAKSEGGASVLGVESAPKAPCPAPWETACRDQQCERRATLETGAQALFTRAADGKAVVGGQVPTFAKAAKGVSGDFPGVTFNWNGNVYKVQFKTGFVFRQSAAGGGSLALADTGGTMPSDLLAEISSADGLSCGDPDKASCKDVGLAPKGKAWADARGGLWSDSKTSGCSPK